MKPINSQARSKGTFPKCIWMQADVVSRKNCRIDYHCIGCRFDQIMKTVARENAALKESGRRPDGRKAKIVSWKDKLRSLPLAKRPCIHHLKGRIEFRTCTHEYHCGSCEFDQYFHDQFFVHAVINPVYVLNIKGFQIPQGYYFHRGHTWVRMEEGNLVKVGLDDFVLRLLGPLDRIKTPLMGKEVKQGRAEIYISRGNHQVRMLSPVSGVVTAINTKLRDAGRLANQHPYTKGWVMAVQADRLRQDLKHLMIKQETASFIEQQVEKLHQIIEDSVGPLSADGGYFGDDIFGSLPGVEWEKLVNTFLCV
ncbi:MAG: glycine cleavage system protein H [Deltaproteobacteria bacterium]|nr:glycine cleavage system protein H [Deltaproteobacteria bacterium]